MGEHELQEVERGGPLAVTTELRTRLLTARAEAMALMPKVERIVSVLREAEAIAATVPGEPLYDVVCDDFLRESGAVALDHVLARLGELVAVP